MKRFMRRIVRIVKRRKGSSTASGAKSILKAISPTNSQPGFVKLRSDVPFTARSHPKSALWMSNFLLEQAPRQARVNHKGTKPLRFAQRAGETPALHTAPAGLRRLPAAKITTATEIQRVEYMYHNTVLSASWNIGKKNPAPIVLTALWKSICKKMLLFVLL